ncbi:lipopolysaccharide 1,6-galactosyltransferase [Citrobacter freundii]|nr:lipopolysaccharide 1,6-galactosyltransferase [Citrobacter freundii]
MKITFVGEAVSGFGGMETVIKNVISTLQGKCQPDECSVFFFCRNDKMDKNWLHGINVDYSFANQKITFFRRRKLVTDFSKWLQENNPDIIICIDVLSCLLASKARMKSGINFKIFSWPHFSLDHKKHAENIVYADHHLAISSGIKRQMIARGVPEDSISLIYNPVSRKEVTIPSPGKEEITTFLYIGRMKFEGQKRIKDLLDGLSNVNGKWKLHAIGDGSDFVKCQNYAQELNIDNHITWHGWQSDPWSLVRNEIRYVSALLLTSSFEGFPMTLLEAMSYGIPCISSDCESGPEDIIKNSINGFLYPPGNLTEFTMLLNKIISEPLTMSANEIKESISGFYDSVYYKNMNETILSVAHKSEK